MPVRSLIVPRSYNNEYAFSRELGKKDFTQPTANLPKAVVMIDAEHASPAHNQAPPFCRRTSDSVR